MTAKERSVKCHGKTEWMKQISKLNEQISYKKLSIKESAKHYITERKMPLLIGASPNVSAAI